MELGAFLSSHGLEQYTATFAAEEIDSVELFRQCTDADLSAMGFKLGARLKLRAAMQVPATRSAKHTVVLVDDSDISIDPIAGCFPRVRRPLTSMRST